jgi:hypothetical protein
MSDEHQDNATIDNIVVPEDEPGEQTKPAKRATDPTFKRNMIIIIVAMALLILAAVGVVVMLVSKSKPKSAGGDVSMVTQLRPSTADDKTPLSPAMRDAVASEAAADFRHRQEQGQRVIIPQEPDNKVVATPPQPAPGANRAYGTADAPLTQEQLLAQRMQEQRVQQLQQQDQETRQARMEGMNRQIDRLIQARDMGAAITRVSLAVPGSSSGQTGSTPDGGAKSGGASAASGAASGSASSAPTIAGALEIFVGETANAIDTYRSDFCSASIVAGKLKGAYLKGKCTQKDEGLSMHYTEMRFNGQAYAIDATGMDEKTSSDAMSDIDVDRRYLQRYVFPIAVAAINGAATVLGQPATSTTSTGGVVLSSTSAASKDQAIAAGVGAGVGALQSMAQAAAQKPVQIKMDDKSPIGIMFNKPVRDPL